MNMHLKEVICTSADASQFWRMPEVYLRGNTVKYLRMPDDVLEKAREYELRKHERRNAGRGGRGGFGGGRGRGGRDGGGRGRGRGRSDGGGRGQQARPGMGAADFPPLG